MFHSGYQILLNGFRLGMYEHIAGFVKTKLDALNNSSPSNATISKVSSGAFSGFIGALAASPLFLVKTRIQSYSPSSHSKAVFGHQHSEVKQGVIFMLKHIYQREGVRGLWRGADASMVRTAVGSSVQLSTYDFFKSELQKFDYFSENGRAGTFKVHFSASLITSFFVCLFMNPFDVASTRMYNQKSNIDGINLF